MSRAPAHEYEPGTTEGMVATVAAMYPGEPVVLVVDQYGVDVRLLRSVAMSDEERAAVLAGDAVTLEDGARVERVRGADLRAVISGFATTATGLTAKVRAVSDDGYICLEGYGWFDARDVRRATAREMKGVGGGVEHRAPRCWGDGHRACAFDEGHASLHSYELEARNVHEELARARKVLRLVEAAAALTRGKPADFKALLRAARKWGAADWRSLALVAGQKPPSPRTRRGVLESLARMAALP